MSLVKKRVGKYGRIPLVIRFTAMLLLVCILLPFVSFGETASATYTPPFRTLRIGLSWNTSGVNQARPAANLSNVAGFGSGFEFGFFDANRNFVSVGAVTNDTSISVMIDRNMRWDAANGIYVEGTTGVAVGCFHVQLTGNTSLAAAQTAAARHADGFIRSVGNNQFIALAGQWTTRAAAQSAVGSRGGIGVNEGTALTTTVVRTGTNHILFEFDHGATPLGIRPRQAGDVRPETSFLHFDRALPNRTERYNGAFRFERRSATLVTVVNMVDIEDYVQGVVPYEMSNSWPLEALKAQAMCARTYGLSMVNKHSAHGFDLCTEMDCQVYRGRRATNANSDRAVTETRGMFVTHTNGTRLCETFYVSSHGGASENSENIWTATRSYLKGVMDPYEANVIPRISGYNWTRTISQTQVTANVRRTHPTAATIASIWVSQYTPTGNVLSITLRDVNNRDYTYSRRAGLQSALGVDAIRSHRFNIGSTVWQPGGNIFVNSPATMITQASQYSVVDAAGNVVSVAGTGMMAIDGASQTRAVQGGGAGITSGTPTGPVNGNFTIAGTGWGHNVGMSQWGAFSQAHYYGRTAEQIIQFYFTGITIVKAY